MFSCDCEGVPHADTCPQAPDWRRVGDLVEGGPSWRPRRGSRPPPTTTTCLCKVRKHGQYAVCPTTARAESSFAKIARDAGLTD